MSAEAADETESVGTRATDSRHAAERIALGSIGLLALVMLGFVFVDWLRQLGGPAGAVGVAVFEGYVGAGGALDALLGTRVFEFPGTIRAVATGVLVGIVGPLVGAFLVHRQMALIGETLAHTAFAGVAIGVVVTGLTGLAGTREQLIFVAFFVSALAALGLQRLTERTDSYGDVPIAIVLTGSFALGTLLISAFRDRIAIGIEIEDFLFGQLAIVTVDGTRMVAVLTVAVVALVVLNYKQLFYITFDEQAARVARINVGGYNSLLIVMTALVVVGAMQILGVILVAGLLVIPAAAASQVGRSFRETLSLSVIFGQCSVLLGIFLALVGGLPAGGSIILVAIAVYALAVGLSDRSTNLSVH
ncbi:iron chelate uptake ABC transporter family permease subunit [Halovenus sp. WSH3]|uniref:Iron chelate uptake ABC transporter family permease subunit n=1 Tax=Halovenus carboxidivorans TaxID=2692199 RepID=A0A6B0T1J6_9EURY|nr:metal ABC transporter permease [Halovenus carboxidivorans]MXR51037.1 iron chelate uptake ABC transporter family permease subunit [Halovenus carboxidivorans]